MLMQIYKPSHPLGYDRAFPFGRVYAEGVTLNLSPEQLRAAASAFMALADAVEKCEPFDRVIIE